MAAMLSARSWAADHWQQLQKLLDDPTHDHGVRALLPRDGLRVAHVVGLFDELNKVNGGPWKTRYEGRMTGGQSAALHVWLYHLGGGADAKLTRPTGGRAADSLKIYRAAERAVKSFRAVLNESMHVEMEPNHPKLMELLERGMQLYNLELGALLVTSTLAVQTTADGDDGGGGGGAPVISDEVKASLRDLRWLIACGTATRFSPLHALAGQDDILYNICDLACIGPQQSLVRAGHVEWRETAQGPCGHG